ncbi:MAG: YjjG family noncanonical pyrimidine nucleotidase [Candidatus Limnocylindrales bacterium]
MTIRYPWLLFDADDTLFDYGRAENEAVRGAFEAQGVAFDDRWLAAYRVVNARAWRALEQGRVTPARLRVVRFEELFAELGLALDPVAFSAVYLGQLAMQAHLTDGALEVVESLRADHRVAIITNGLSDVQRPRIARSPLAGVVEHLVISEEVGAAKPDPAIFAVALERMGGPDPSDVLVIGDSLSSDIAGGVAAGLDTCWFNPRAQGRGDAPTPTYEIRRLEELPALLGH